MLRAPKTSSMSFTSLSSVVNTFVKLRQVEGDVACLASGQKNFAYRGIFRVKAIHFSQMVEDEQQRVIEGFQRFLGTIAFPIQILIRNQSYDPEHYLRMLASGKGFQAPVTRDHAKFVRALASRRALVTREFYVIVPADPQIARNKTETFLRAQVQLKQRMEELARQLEQVGLATKRLTTPEIVQLYQSCYAPWEESYAEEIREKSSGGPTGSSVGQLADMDLVSDYQELAARTLELKRQKQQEARLERKAAREEAKKKHLPKFVKVPDLILPTTIQVFPSYLRIERDEQHEYARTLALVSYPHRISPGWFDSIIQVNEPNIDFSIHVNPLPRESASTRLNRKVLQFRGATLVSMRQGRAADPTIIQAQGDIERLRENIAYGNEQALAISVFIQVRGRDRRELDKRSERIARAVQSLDCRTLPTHWQHHVGLMSCLPEATNLLGRGRLFGTNAAATFYPFTNSDISMETGVMFGAHPGGGLIILNPFKRPALANSNLVVLAKPGAGKSFFLKAVASRLLSACPVYTLDSEGGYDAMCEIARGQCVRLTSDSLLINPFEFYGNARNLALSTTPSKGEANFFREKLLNLTTLLELLLSDEGTLAQKEKAVLYTCLLKVYEKRGISADPATHGYIPPNMQEFCELLAEVLRNDERLGIGQELCERLERQVYLFPERTQVLLDGHFINFNLHALSNTLKPVGMLLVAEFLWTRLYQESRQPNGPLPSTLLLMDEVWPLMKFQQGAKFLTELARHMPGYGSGLWCSTQHVRDFLRSDEGQSMQAMAAMKFLMRQDASNIDQVAQAFHLNPAQQRFLQGVRRGEGLFATKNWSQMEVLASPLEAKMASIAPASVPAQEQQATGDAAQNRPQALAYEK